MAIEHRAKSWHAGMEQTRIEWKVFNAGEPCAQQGIQSIERNVQPISLDYFDSQPCKSHGLKGS